MIARLISMPVPPWSSSFFIFPSQSFMKKRDEYQSVRYAKDNDDDFHVNTFYSGIKKKGVRLGLQFNNSYLYFWSLMQYKQ